MFGNAGKYKEWSQVGVDGLVDSAEFWTSSYGTVLYQGLLELPLYGSDVILLYKKSHDHIKAAHL